MEPVDSGLVLMNKLPKKPWLPIAVWSIGIVDVDKFGQLAV